MKTLITFLLCGAMLALPFHSQAQSNPPPPDVEPQALYGILIVGAAVVIVGAAAYVIYKVDKHAKNQLKCPSCQTPNQKTATSCANCGKSIRCEECSGNIPKDATKCPTCDEPVPPPKKPLALLQTSTDGVSWASAAPTNGLKFHATMEVLKFNNEAEFTAWKAEEEVVSQIPIPTQQQALFRLSSAP